MTGHDCNQVKNIEAISKTVSSLEENHRILQNNDTNIMDLLKNTNEKVEKIYAYLFEGDMEKKYISRELFNQTMILYNEKLIEKEAQINELKRNQNKVARLIISTVMLAVLATAIYKQF